MARTEIPVTVIGFQGGVTDVTYTAGDATNGHQFDNNGDQIVTIKNGGGAPISATFSSVDDQYGRSEDLVLAIGAGEDATAGPFIPSIWNQGNGSKMFLDLDVDTSVEVVTYRYTPRR